MKMRIPEGGYFGWTGGLTRLILYWGASTRLSIARAAALCNFHLILLWQAGLPRSFK